jgi:hypothetical protein
MTKNKSLGDINSEMAILDNSPIAEYSNSDLINDTNTIHKPVIIGFQVIDDDRMI